MGKNRKYITTRWYGCFPSAGSGGIEVGGGSPGRSGIYTGTSPKSSVRSPCVRNSGVQGEYGMGTDLWQRVMHVPGHNPHFQELRRERFRPSRRCGMVVDGGGRGRALSRGE